MPITWNSSYNTGVRSIDLQHQELVELINELETLSAAQVHGAPLQQLIQRLNQYVIFHFDHEETMMARSFVTPELRDQHTREHADFRAMLASRTGQIRAGDENTTVTALFEYLQSWLLAHIQHTDLELARQLHTKKPPAGFQK